MAQFLSEQMLAFINAVDGGGIFGKALLFLLLLVVLNTIIRLFNAVFKSTIVNRVVGLVNACVWYIYFVTIGWSFFAALIALATMLHMLSCVLSIDVFGARTVAE